MFHRYWNSANISLCCHFINGDDIISNVCTWHNMCKDFHDRFITIYKQGKYIFHRIWITMRNHLWNRSLVMCLVQIDTLHKFHNASFIDRNVHISVYFPLQTGALWDIVLVYFEISAQVYFHHCIVNMHRRQFSVTQHPARSGLWFFIWLRSEFAMYLP